MKIKEFIFRKSAKIANSARKAAGAVWKKLQCSREDLRYYAVLSVILAVLGTAAYAYRYEQKGLDEAEPISEKSEMVLIQTTAQPMAAPEVRDAFTAPVNGEIVGAYAAGELVWSDDLQQWQTHPAVDIRGLAGEAVVAAADGVVLEAYDDALYGNTIVIDHGQIGILRYASLNTLRMVEVGQRIKQGETISAIGTCPGEASVGAHVHLEFMINGEYANPEDLFSE